jgi:alkylhydroperoxidase domain protein/CMD domain protein
MTVSNDLIDYLAEIDEDSETTGPIAALRHHRAQARENAQRSFTALFEPTDPAVQGNFSNAERYAVAAFVTGLHGGATAAARATGVYADMLADEVEDTNPDLVAVLAAVVSDARALVNASGLTGPYGDYREPDLAGESAPGPTFTVSGSERRVLGDRLSAAVEFAHVLVLHPRDSRPERLAPLAQAGWTPTEVVSLAQLIAFLTFQVRTAHGLGVAARRIPVGDVRRFDGTTAPRHPHSAGDAGAVAADGDGDLTGGAFDILSYPDLARPTRFVTHSLGWVPWVPPTAEVDLTDRQREALVDPLRAKSEYFRLLARDPDALEARTLTDRDIFFNTTDGVGRAERELSAAVTSRFNGCVYCASVHTGRAIKESESYPDASDRAAAVQRLCDEGPGADLGDPVWNAVRDASVALAATPVRFSTSHVDALRAAGLDDGSVLDVINGAAFFNWANRMMLSLGEPELPERFR